MVSTGRRYRYTVGAGPKTDHTTTGFLPAAAYISTSKRPPAGAYCYTALINIFSLRWRVRISTDLMSEGIKACQGPGIASVGYSFPTLQNHPETFQRAALGIRMLNMLGNRFNGTLSNPAINICSSSLGNESHFWSIPSPEILR
ncbi:predicted protein [Histoplasma capsulatum var. duboisii H88]|uniref:Predicted protein n=1 Tax=Ajellomyces capsulatus (strain H88) TaxID=544711 RepID=F0U771_AJEC8|nr:predicted protein [Histoplasma capsulatum var. duboisii H88]